MSLRCRLASALVALLAAHPVLAQEPPAPREPMPRFESLLADPDMSALGARVMVVGESDSQLEDTFQGEAVLGENLPLVALATGAKPWSLGLGASVMVRFALQTTNSPMVAQDWNFQLNVANRRGPWTLVGMLWHESEHLGDEYLHLFGQGTPSGSREGVTAWAFYQDGPWRFGASAGAAFRLANASGRGRFSGGFDYAPVRHGGGILPRAGAFVDFDAHADWKPAFSARLGMAIPIAAGSDVIMSLAAYSGRSPLGYFRQEQLRYVGVEFRFDL